MANKVGLRVQEKYLWRFRFILYVIRLCSRKALVSVLAAMDMMVALAGAASMLVALLVKWLMGIKQGKADAMPPGPWKLPIIGTLHLLLGKQPHLAITELSRKYGPLMSLHLGSVRVVVASSPEMAKEFLQTHDLVFSSRPKVSNAEFLTYGFSDVMWAPYGQHWRTLRKVCVLELFTAKRVELFQTVRIEEIFNVVQRLFQAAQKNQVVNLKERLTELAWSVIARMVSNRQDIVDIKEGLKTKSTIDIGLELAGAFNLGDYIPLFRGLDFQGYGRRTRIVHEQLDAFFQGLIDKHVQQQRPCDAVEDFIDILMSIQGENGEQSISNDKIKATVQDIFAAGTDTSSVTVEWAMTELVRHPQLLQKAQDEIDEVVGGDRIVEEADIPKLSYLQAIVKETLRLHPPGPLLQHESMEPCEVRGYHLPAKTRVIINLYGISRDPAIWERPLEFDPERFFRNPSIDMKGQHFELIPFGSGRRICPGLALGLRTVHLALAQLLHSFNWDLPGNQFPDVDEICGMTLPKANPLLLTPSARLPLRLYTSKTS